MANPKEYIAIIAEAMDQEIESSEELVQMYRDDNMPEESSVFRFELESGDYDVAYLVALPRFWYVDFDELLAAAIVEYLLIYLGMAIVQGHFAFSINQTSLHFNS